MLQKQAWIQQMQQETSVENDPAGEAVSEPSGPMAAFEGAAQDGFRADISAMSNDEIDDSSRDT